MGNPICDLNAKAYTKRVGGTTTAKPNVPPTPATICRLNPNAFTSIDPSKTPVKAYTKRTK